MKKLIRHTGIVLSTLILIGIIVWYNYISHAVPSSSAITPDSLARLQQQYQQSLNDFRAETNQKLGNLWDQVLLTSFRLPDTLYFCGQRVPLWRQIVRDKIELELFRFARQRHNLVIWYKRQGRYFPFIEQTLRDMGLPDDLKYVVVLESQLNPKARSGKGAGGLWQFMLLTGANYGLKKNGIIDQRLDPWLATRAAGLHLIDLYQLSKNYQEQGDWPLALAQYVCKESTVRLAIKAAGHKDYFTLNLPPDGERYAPQVLALKIILSQPHAFGLDLFEQYPPLPEPSDTLISLPHGGTVKSLADSAGISLDEFTLLNTSYLVPHVPPGTYQVKKIAQIQAD